MDFCFPLVELQFLLVESKEHPCSHICTYMYEHMVMSGYTLAHTNRPIACVRILMFSLKHKYLARNILVQAHQRLVYV